jgi:GNAT superfamily N-acetyltransferase
MHVAPDKDKKPGFRMPPAPPDWPPRTGDDDLPPGKLRTVITYLEMGSPPARAPVPPPNLKMALMRAVEPTTSFYRYLYKAVGEPWLWYERTAMDDETLAELISHSDVEIFVLYVNGVPAGYFELDCRDREDIELSYFGLVREFIGRRVGPYLLDCALEAAWQHSPKRVRVNTCTLDHPKALATYQRAGFVPYAQREIVIDDPRRSQPIPLDTTRNREE